MIFFDPKFKVYRMRETIRVGSGAAAKSVRLIASGETKSAAKVAFEAKRLALLTGAEKKAAAAAAPKGEKSFIDFAREWLKVYPSSVKNRENTKINKTYHVEVRLIPYFERLAAERAEVEGGAARPFTLAEITPKVIDRLIADLTESPRICRAKEGSPRVAARPLTAKTVSNIAQTLRRILVTAKRWDEIDAAPEVPNVKIVRPKFDFFTFDETERLISTIERAATQGTPGAAEDLALILTGLRTGGRAGELLALQWSNIDFVKGEIRIEAQLHRKIRNRLEPPKAGSRTVPFRGALAEVLKRHKHLRMAPGTSGLPGGPLHWVFADADGNHYNRKHLQYVVAKWCRRAGLRTMHPHGLRHTFASHCVMRGVPLKQVQEWLGHSSITMTLRYAHLAPGSGNEQINLLDAPAAPTHHTKEQTR